MKCYFLSDMIFYSAKPQNSKAIDTVKPHEEEQEMKQRLSVLFFSLFWLGMRVNFHTRNCSGVEVEWIGVPEPVAPALWFTGSIQIPA